MYNNRVIECSRLTDYTFHLIHVVNLLQLLLNSFQMILVFVVVYGFLRVHWLIVGCVLT
jgi:hypothetical protein